MAQTSNTHEYADVKAVLDAALAAGGARYTLPTKSAAIRWRFRAYYYRDLLRKLENERLGNLPGYRATTPYDGWAIRIEGTGEKNTPHDVLIKIVAPLGNLKSLDGTPLSIEQTQAPAADDEALLAAVRALNLGDNE